MGVKITPAATKIYLPHNLVNSSLATKSKRISVLMAPKKGETDESPIAI